MLDFGPKSLADMAAEHAVTTLRGYGMVINILSMHITHTHSLIKLTMNDQFKD